jgi:UDP-GlcNAc:undecaprenyl-phosphate GlcNAc-1-phosphate transferase
MAIVRRRLTGRSIYTTDRGHMHHCLVRQGHTGGRLLLIVGSLCSLTGVGAIASAAFGNELIAIITVATAFALLIATRSFGHAELNLLTNRVRRFAGSLLRRAADPNPVLHDEQVRLHGKHKWEHLWETLRNFAQEQQLDGVELMVNLPSAGEEYHATWKTRSIAERHEAWRSDIPLVIDGVRAGHIRLIGVAPEGSFCDWMSQITSGLRPFENELHAIIASLRTQHSPATGSLKDSASILRLPTIAEHAHS